MTVLLLLVTNLNSFTIPWIMTGGGPAGSSDIWITQIYQLAFGRIRFGLASAYSVILFVVMMALGLLLRPGADPGRKEAGMSAVALEPRPAPKRRRGKAGPWGVAAHRLPGPARHLHRAADGLDAARPRSRRSSPRCSIRRNGSRPSRRSSSTRALLSPDQRGRAGVPALPAEQRLGLDRDDGARASSSRCRRPTPSRASASPAASAVLRGAGPEHVPGRGLPDAAVHHDEVAGAGEHGTGR